MTEPDSAPSKPTYTPLARIGVVVVLALAIGAFVLAFQTMQTGVDEPVVVSGAPGEAVSVDGVQALLPGEGAQVLAQQRIGIQLADGWTGDLMLLPPSGAAIPLPRDELDPGPATELIFTPGDGQTVKRLPRGRVCLAATIWSPVRGRDATERVQQWCFNVI